VAAVSVAAAALVAMGGDGWRVEWCAAAAVRGGCGSRAGPVSPQDIHNSRPMECFTVQMEACLLRSTENRDIPKFVTSPII
jgi:hypothetical protein